MPEIIFLGTGTSNGIPVIGCGCDVCRSTDPRGRRTRTSALVRYEGHSVLIDTATELRRSSAGQRCAPGGRSPHDPRPRRPHRGLRRSPALQRVGGERISRSMRIPARHRCFRAICLYLHRPFPVLWWANRICFCTRSMGPFELFGREIVPIPVLHGRLPITGFRFGDLAYITDAKEIPAPSLDLLRDLDVLVLNGLRVRSHPTHLSFSEAVEIVQLCGLGSPTWFTCRTRRVTPRLNDSSAPESRSPGTVWSSRPATVNSSSGPSHRGNRLSATTRMLVSSGVGTT